ncbi:MAG: DNA-processing protein DprA [Clostridiales bacterium]|nr:DNA-processing protein DprA [Clostridiales bacterium]
MGEEIYRLWLSTLHGAGSRKQNALLDFFGSARAVFDATADALRSARFLTENHIALILENRSLSRIEKILRVMEQQKIVFVSREHQSFPPLLKLIPDPPVGIFYMGELPDGALPCAAIIGSRRCSEYGLTSARLLAKPLAQNGVVVVSGMARGIDGMAHKGALEGGGKTVAVLGCGVDICYPKEHRALRADIIRNGCLVSEYPPGVTPMPAYFPARNRIISGLSSVVVVVEAARKSGTLITVDQAQDQGREIMAVPGSILSKLSEGTNILIRDGAYPAATYEDVLALLGKVPAAAKPREKPENAANALAPEEKIVYDSLNFEPEGFDSLVLRTGSQPNALHYVLTMLELKGFIKKLPGMRYIRNI